MNLRRPGSSNLSAPAAYFEMVTRSSFSTGSRIPFLSNFRLLLSHRYPSLPLFPHRTSLLVNSSKAMPCSKRRTLLFQRLELRRRVRHVTVGRQFPIDRNRSSPTTSLIYRLEIVPTKKAMLVCIYIVTKARFRKKKKVETTRQNTIT